MSQQDRDKWNQRYAEDSYQKGNPVTLLENWIHKIPVGKALDIACGAGRNAIFMARAGFDVDAIDISREGLNKAGRTAHEQALEIRWIEHDFDQAYDFETNYNLIIVLWYVNLELIRQLCGCLAPGGYLLCEEHLLSDEPVIGPGSARFRVAPGQVRDTVSALDILMYEESIQTNDAGELVASARVVARN